MTLLEPPSAPPDPNPDLGPDQSPGPGLRPADLQDELVLLGDALITAHRLVHSAAADRFRAIHVLRQRWEDVHGASLAADRNGILSRSLRAEVAAILSIGERTAESLLWTARTLVHELPTTLERLGQGRFSERHARILAEATADLDDQERAELERRALEHAEVLSPAKFARKVRTLRMLLHPESLEERKKTAFDQREVELEPVSDGMAWLHLYLAAEDAVAAWNFADTTARRLAVASAEARTVTQLRADVLRDLLLDGAGQLPPREGETELREQIARPRGIVPSVHVTAPALALAGVEDAPAELAGYGPLDAETARRLVGASSGFYRILTDPGTGVVVQFGREKYAVPAELRRFLVQRDGTCRFVGCNRPAVACEIDHTLAWEDCGCTDADNLAHECKNHHLLKHHGKWKVRHHPEEPGVLLWTSPIGYEFTTEPAMKLRRSSKGTKVVDPGRTVANVRAQTDWATSEDENAPF